jgi:exonuclease III
MSCLSWNCRGLGNATTIKELRELARRVASSVLCVQETQVPKARVKQLKTTLGFDFAFAVSSCGRSGGLGIFWKK